MLSVGAACNDKPVTVRERPDGSGSSDGSGPANDGGTLACGAAVLSVYDSPNFTTNAQVELDLRANAFAIDRTMALTEGATTAITTTKELTDSFTAGVPSLQSVSTPETQDAIGNSTNGYLTAYGNAIGNLWSPDLAANGGAENGGKYDGTFYFSAVGLDLRSATSRTLLGGAFLQHAIDLASGPMTEATLDRVVASFGATPALANRTDDDAGADRDGLLAELASQRDNKNSNTPGMYRQMRTALLTAKAAVIAGNACQADLDAALTDFFATWEKTTYASVIYYLNLAALAAMTDPMDGPDSLRALGNAIGLVQSYLGIPQARRLITDDRIQALLGKLGADAPFELVTDPTHRTSAIISAIQDIAILYGFSQADVESFKQSF
ncbi:MAG: hypothetical protein FWD69_02325 [Polyangiaceae bacterium]|nr:hypothetical protein [Polyangiaceae bacterium]